MRYYASNPYQPPAREPEPPLLSRRFRFAIAVATLLLVSAWLVYSASFLGALLPGAIGVLASGYCGWRVSRAVVCSLLAYVVGASAIVLATFLLPVVYPEMMSLLADDDWIKIETRIYKSSGVLGAIAGAFAGLALHAKQFTNAESSDIA